MDVLKWIGYIAAGIAGLAIAAILLYQLYLTVAGVGWLVFFFHPVILVGYAVYLVVTGTLGRMEGNLVLAGSLVYGVVFYVLYHRFSKKKKKEK